jgi:NitT/TauT family transport system ATP-binding protein
MSFKNELSESSLNSNFEALVELKGVSKVFDSRRKGADTVIALRETTQNIRRGEIITIVGPSGCGKSTMLSLIAGLETPTSGEVFVNSKLIIGPYTNSGIVFQKDLLLHWRNVLDNILLQAEVRNLDPEKFKLRALDLLNLVGLKGFENFYPHELSGGMRQRVSICRALLHDPELLLMDEPFAALDAITRDQLALDFDKFVQSGDRTVVFITHNMDEAVFLGDRVMVMTPRPGQIAEVIDINLPRPRNLSIKDTIEFIKYTAQVRNIFMKHGVLKNS